MLALTTPAWWEVQKLLITAICFALFWESLLVETKDCLDKPFYDMKSVTRFLNSTGLDRE